MVYLLCFSGLNELVPENLLSVFDEYELEVSPPWCQSRNQLLGKKKKKSPKTLGTRLPGSLQFLLDWGS